jgi:hypothetical protein
MTLIINMSTKLYYCPAGMTDVRTYGNESACFAQDKRVEIRGGIPRMPSSPAKTVIASGEKKRTKNSLENFV